MSGISELVDKLLERRGIVDEHERERFLNPSYDDELHDPFLMRGMREAVERIISAVNSGERIAIYSDFDADGIPGAVILHDFFKKIGYDNFTNYIPHRDTEGYGFHTEAVDTLARDGVSLIITVDVGINAVEATQRARELGVDVIITDHHEPLGDAVPSAVAILNPKQQACEYPFKELCGAGVAYKLVQALILQARALTETKQDVCICFAHQPGATPPQTHTSCFVYQIGTLVDGWEKWLLDMVALATVADMVPLTGENRTLVHWGLKVLRKSPRRGVRALCNKLRINQALLDENDIGFSIAPRINASSRMGHPDTAFKLLTTHDDAQAQAYADELERLNRQRKARVATITRQVREKLSHREAGSKQSNNNDVVVSGDPAWSPALVGLAAGSLADKLGKVVCLWGREGTGLLKGSCRAGNTEHSVVEMFEHAGDALLHYGGHKSAGGFAVSDEAVHTLQDVFNTALSCMLSEQSSRVNPSRIGTDANDAQESDITLSLSDVTVSTVRELMRLSPFGIGNPKPVLRFESVTVMRVRHFGKEQNHLEIFVRDASGLVRKASKFFATAESFSPPLQEGATITLHAHLEESNFAGRRTLELRIVDIIS